MTEQRNRTNSADAGLIRGEEDLGRTAFGDVGEVTKHDIRLAAFGDCEEANVAVGFALSFGGYNVEVMAALTSMQNDLFDLAADLSAPIDQTTHADPIRITEEHVTWVDRAHEHYSSQLAPVDGYVLPGGTVAAALLFRARIAVRRAERTTLQAIAEHPRSINPLAARYLNSASSLLFVLARAHNAELGDTMWRPLASVTPPEEYDNDGGGSY